MPKIRLNSTLLLTAVLFVSASEDSAFASKKRKHPAKQQQHPIQQTQVAPAEIPSTLEHQPATAPQVALQNGQLTIVARNSVLSDILHAVQSQTGAAVEMPSNASERVVGFFGPGPPRDVLASLLNGSHFNYVLLGSQANPSVLEHVILIAKSGPDDVAPPPAAQPQPGGQPQTGQPQLQPPGQASPDAEEMPVEEAPEEAPEAESDQAPQGGEQQSPIQNGQPGIKTPEQLLQELQRQQQQMQQQQQQPPQAPGAPQGLPQQR